MGCPALPCVKPMPRARHLGMVAGSHACAGSHIDNFLDHASYPCSFAPSL